MSDEQSTEPTTLLPPSEESQMEERRAPKQKREPSPYETAMQIADQLGETVEGARKQLVRIVMALGRTQARALLSETLQIEENGGMMVPDGSRRRTIGGIYFHLAYTKGIPKEGKALRRPAYKPASGQEKYQQSDGAQTSKKPVASFAWEDRVAVIADIGTEKGTATTVKITLIGQLGKYEDRGACIVGVMQSGDKVPALPKGVPTPQPTKTNYVVYIGAKQWKNVAAQASDPEDAFIIEGYPQSDPQTSAISVFATNITSKKLQAAKRQGQPQG